MCQPLQWEHTWLLASILEIAENIYLGFKKLSKIPSAQFAWSSLAPNLLWLSNIFLSCLYVYKTMDMFYLDETGDKRDNRKHACEYAYAWESSLYNDYNSFPNSMLHREYKCSRSNMYVNYKMLSGKRNIISSFHLLFHHQLLSSWRIGKGSQKL